MKVRNQEAVTDPHKAERIRLTEEAIALAERCGILSGLQTAIHLLDAIGLDTAMRPPDIADELRAEYRMTAEQQHPDPWPLLNLARARLIEGAVEYGDASLASPPSTTLDEIRQELADVCGWACILARKVEALGAGIERATVQGTEAGGPRTRIDA